MIYGIGVDTTTISRIEKSLESEHFFNRVFSEKEREFLKNKKNPQSAAANFAGKEAFLKSLKMGIGDIALNEISILRHSSGAPYFELLGKALDIVSKNNLTAHISLTHEKDLATAFVILEKNL